MIYSISLENIMDTYSWLLSHLGPIYVKRQRQCCDNSAMKLAILFSLENNGVGLQPYSWATPLFLMRTALLASSQSCRSLDADAWCKCYLSHRLHLYGVSPVWMRICAVSPQRWGKHRPHSLHLNGFSPRCSRLWICTVEIIVNTIFAQKTRNTAQRPMINCVTEKSVLFHVLTCSRPLTNRAWWLLRTEVHSAQGNIFLSGLCFCNTV